MKRLKFAPELVNLILKGKKTATWRMFDDKDLQQGDNLVFINSETLEEFAKAIIKSVKEKKLGELTDEDWEGHEKFASEQEMYQAYAKYYKQIVDSNTTVKIIKFKLN